MHEHEKEVDYKVAIVTVSSSRYEKHGKVRGIENIPQDDESGKLIFEEFKDSAVEYILVRDSVEDIRTAVFEALTKADVCIITGGTGVARSDVTVEAIEPLFSKKLSGFGEIFRMLSYNEIGVSAILSRATAGLISDKPVFCLPGSKKAVKLGLEIIKPLLKHLLSHSKGLA